jgi:hypothetical protein
VAAGSFRDYPEAGPAAFDHDIKLNLADRSAQRELGPLRLPGRDWRSDFRANYLAGDHQFHAPVLLPA